MKLLLWCLIVLLYSTTLSFAYVEDREVGEAETMAGDQNTNLYRLQSSGAIKIKQFKEIDKIIDRRKAGGKYVDTSDIDALYRAEKQDKAQEELKEKEQELAKLTENPKALRIENTPDVYEHIITLQRQCVKDRDIAASLLSELKLGGRR